jgi:hypothetical protein
MSTFKSADFKPATGAGIPKLLNPGTHYCRIVDITLDEPPYKKDAYFINLKLEGEDRGDDFQGIDLDKNNPSLGKYRGQVAYVKSGQYPFSTYTFDGKVIERDQQIFRWINNLARQMDVLDKMNAKGVEADTIEEYVMEVRKYLIDPELWGHYTIAGKEYFNEGYSNPNYRLFFPKSIKLTHPFSAIEDEDKNPVNFISFDAAVHIIKDAEATAKKEEGDAEVSGFEPTVAATPSIEDDFSMTSETSELDLPFE